MSVYQPLKEATMTFRRLVWIVLFLLPWGISTATGLDDGRKSDEKLIRGAGTSLVTGGTGAPSFVPVLTKFAVHWRDGTGQFECLALAPNAPAGTPGSGNFYTNVMYVTGIITSAEVRGSVAILKGTATVTGVGAGSHLPFTATAERGGPGTRLVLEVSGLTFQELVLDGNIDF